MKVLRSPIVEYVILADRAEALNGKLYLMGGGWDTLHAESLERAVPLHLGIGLLIPEERSNSQLLFQVYVDHPEYGKIPSEIHFGIGAVRPPEALKHKDFRLALAVQGAWILPAIGTYDVVVALNGRIAKRTAFHVAHASLANSDPGLQRAGHSIS